MRKMTAFLTAAAMTVGLLHSLPAWADEPASEKDAIAIYFLYSENTEDTDKPDAVLICNALYGS